MGLLDYYRQFDDMDESEFNQGLRERRAREKAVALEHVPPLDLSSTEWPELPNAEVVGASVYQARGKLNGYPDERATQVRRELAERHYIKSDQIVLGNGASDLMKTAVYRLASDGAELVTPWPSNPLYPALAARAGARSVEVPLANGHFDVDSLVAATGRHTRVMALCNPNDPTGAYIGSERLGELLTRLPEHVHVMLDEAYVQYQEVEDEDACLKLVEAFPRLLVFRTFSRIYGLSGLRAGYVVGSPTAAVLLASLAPALGVNALTQAGVLQALRRGDRDIERRRATVIQERRRIKSALEQLPVEATDSQANFLWLRAHGMNGEELATRLEQSRVLVAPGGPLGDERFVRVAVRDSQASDRLLWALGQALVGAPAPASSVVEGEA